MPHYYDACHNAMARIRVFPLLFSGSSVTNYKDTALPCKFLSEFWGIMKKK
jgi:hypothetical protein